MTNTIHPPHPTGRLRLNVANFTGSDLLEIEASYHPNPTIGANISLFQSGGSMSFQHTMTLDQAHEMAAKLCELVMYADALELEAAVMLSEFEAATKAELVAEQAAA